MGQKDRKIVTNFADLQAAMADIMPQNPPMLEAPDSAHQIDSLTGKFDQLPLIEQLCYTLEFRKNKGGPYGDIPALKPRVIAHVLQANPETLRKENIRVTAFVHRKPDGSFDLPFGKYDSYTVHCQFPSDGVTKTLDATRRLISYTHAPTSEDIGTISPQIAQYQEITDRLVREKAMILKPSKPMDLTNLALCIKSIDSDIRTSKPRQESKKQTTRRYPSLPARDKQTKEQEKLSSIKNFALLQYVTMALALEEENKVKGQDIGHLFDVVSKNQYKDAMHWTVLMFPPNEDNIFFRGGTTRTLRPRQSWPLVTTFNSALSDYVGQTYGQQAREEYDRLVSLLKERLVVSPNPT